MVVEVGWGGTGGGGGGEGRLVSVLVRERLFFLSVSSASLFSFVGRWWWWWWWWGGVFSIGRHLR